MCATPTLWLEIRARDAQLIELCEQWGVGKSVNVGSACNASDRKFLYVYRR